MYDAFSHFLTQRAIDTKNDFAVLDAFVEATSSTGAYPLESALTEVANSKTEFSASSSGCSMYGIG